MFIALYARQSVEKERSVSIETQISFCYSLIKHDERNINVLEFSDKGYSGKNTNRPAFQRLMQYVYQGQIKKIIVYKLDRISRSLIDFADMLCIFKKHGVEFVSSQEMFDTSSPYGQMLMKLLMVFAEFERESIAGRVRDAYIKRSSLGLYTGGRKVYGYNTVPCVQNGIETKSYEINSQEEDTVRFIFTEYAKPSISLRRLQSILLSSGITDEKGAFFSASRLSGMLRNPLYAKADNSIYKYFEMQNTDIIGAPSSFDGSGHIMLYGKTKHNLSECRAVLLSGKGIVDSKTWLACQTKLSKNKKFGTAVSNKKSFLSGKLICSKCHRTMTTIKGGSRVYFFCTGKTHAKTCTGINTTVYVSDIENLIYSCIEEKLCGISYAPTVMCDDYIFEKNRLQSQLLQTQQEKSALAKAVFENDFGSAACSLLNNEAERLTLKEKQLTELLQSLIDEKSEKCNSIDFSLSWKNASFCQKREVSDILIDRITVQPDASLEIVWKI